MLEVSSIYPRMLAKNPKQYRDLIRCANGKYPVYRSVYHSEELIDDKLTFADAKINQIYLDFDPHENMHAEVLNFIKNLYNDRIKFRVNFSGRGFHIFIACEDQDIDKKTYLTLLHQHIINKYQLTLFDPKIIGNIKQLRRIENTINPRSKLYCIPLTYEEILNLTLDEIKELAKTSRPFDVCWIDGNNIELKNINLKININETHISSGNGEFHELDDVIPEPCIAKILYSTHPGHDERFLLCMWLSYHFRGGTDINDFDLNALSEKIIAFMCNLNWDDYSEALNTAKSTRYQVYNLIAKKYNFPPNCEWRRLRGICCSESCYEEKCKAKENYNT